MKPLPPWEVVEEEPLHDCAVFQVWRTRVRSPHSGGLHPIFRLAAPDWVNVVPLTDAGEVVLVRQFRHGSRRTTLEIPGGMVDPGESPEEAGRRELREETGYACTSLEAVGAVNPNPALFANAVHTFVARGAHRVGEPENQGAEHTVVVRVPEAALPGLLRAGEIDHALVVAALHFWRLADACAPVPNPETRGR